MQPFSDTVTTSGHLVDSGVMARILDTVIQHRGEFEVIEFAMGRTNQEASRLRLRIGAPSPAELDALLALLHDLGCARESMPPLGLAAAPAAGIAPADFYSTTNHPTRVQLDGHWIEVEELRMDAAIVVRDGRALCTKLRDLRAGDPVVCGIAGVQVTPPPQDRDRGHFAFMANDISSERKVRLLVARLAAEMQALRARGGRIVVVAGPVVIHTGGSDGLTALIRGGFVQALLAGNALAVHDAENVLFGTSLGISTTTGLPVEEGHHHHIHSINRINTAGGLRAAVESGALPAGIVATCVRQGVPFVLAGSLRDDGPLLDTLTDMNAAQDAYARELRGAALVLILSSMLHGIATGNMLPSTVRTICVDINPAVVTKLADRGTTQALGLVTDVGLFLHLLAQELGLAPAAQP